MSIVLNIMHEDDISDKEMSFEVEFDDSIEVETLKETCTKLIGKFIEMKKICEENKMRKEYGDRIIIS